MACVTPSNLQFLIDMFEFVASCPYQIDQKTGELLIKGLKIALRSRVKGFSNCQKVREAMLGRVANAVNQTLLNHNLQAEVHRAVLDHLND